MLEATNGRADVLVIGGGVVGVCAAHYLAEAGRQVVVVDKGEICSGCSHGNAGMLVPSHCVPLAEPGVMRKGLRWMLNPQSPFWIKPRFDTELLSWLWRFRRACSAQHVRRSIPLLRDLQLQSLRLYKELSARADVDDFGFEQRGALYVARTEQGMESVAEEARLVAEHGMDAEVVDGARIRELEPTTRIAAIGGAYYPQNAHLQPAHFVRNLARSLENRGVVMHTATEVLGMQVNAKRISVVETTRGQVAVDEVVLAAGSWSPALARQLGLSLPIQAAKGYSITVERPEASPSRPIVLTEAKVAVTPMGETLRFAGTLELAGMDLTANMRRIKGIVDSVPGYLPEIDPATLPTLEVWRGLRPCTPDGLPIMCRSPQHENLTIAAGHATIGLSLGPVSGWVTARLVMGEDPGVDVHALRVERFG